MRYLKYLLCLIILFPVSVKGLVCDNATKVRLQRLAQNITTSYDYIEENGSATFNFTFNNMSSELYLYDTINERRYDYSGNVLELGGFKSGISYKFEVRSNDVYCGGNVLYYIYITTPHYNPFYSDPICNGISYKYCNKWQKNDFTYEEFIKNVEDYKKLGSVKEEPKEEVKGILDYIVEFYVSYYYLVLPAIILISLSYIIINRKKNDLF